MVVERATEPSNYSPRSSIRGTSSDFETGPTNDHGRSVTPITTVVDVRPSESPQETLLPSPIKQEEEGMGVEPVAALMENKTKLNVGTIFTPSKTLLGKGRIDAKAQDDFITFMLSKK